MENFIGDHPPKEMYAPGVEVDCQCARCGSYCYWVDCWNGCDEGFEDRHDEDPLWYGHELYECHVCEGRGGWNVCGSGEEWCQANPMPGREEIKHGQLEWFTVTVR